MLDESENAVALRRNNFDMKSIMQAQESKKKKKGKKKKGSEETVTDEFKVNTDDARFQSLYTNSKYAIDPTNPNFKKTKAMNEILDERQKRRSEFLEKAPTANDNRKPTDVEGDEQKKKKRKKSELSMLVESVKRKSKKQKTSQ